LIDWRRWQVDDRGVAKVDATPVGWRGWSSETNGLDREVTCEALGADTAVRSRLFPKVRSWWALGAPVELLSPLAVLRLLLPFETALLPLAAWTGGWPPGRRWMVLVITGILAVAWVATLAVRRAGRWASGLVAASVLMVLAGPGLWAAGHHLGGLLVVVLALPVSLFVALFLGGRAVVAHQLLLAAVVASVAAVDRVAGALTIVAIVCVATSLAPGLVWLLVRSIQRVGTVDADTGVPNAEGIAAWSHRRQAHGEPLVVTVVVLSGLLEARQALGYAVATELVRRVVENLGQVVPPAGVVGRVGGDELVVAVPASVLRPDAASSVPLASDALGAGARPAGTEVPDPSLDAQAYREPPGDIRGGVSPWSPARVAGHRLAQIVSQAVSEPRYLAGPVEVALRAHVGIAVTGDDGDGAAELMRRAALRARQAAATGDRSADADLAADHGVLPDGSPAPMDADDLTLLAGLRGAAERGELRLVYQPQVAAATGTVVGVEALLRWQSPAHGTVPPMRFVPLAERTGLIDRLTLWVVEEALDAAARWRAAGIGVPVSVNLSARSLGVPGLAAWILAQLAARQLPAEVLTVEVTETAALDTGRARRLLGPLHDAGVRVSIDDFGTGYTSLATLPVLPVDELKVDMQFVRRSSTSPADAAIVASVRTLAHALGLSTVAEGVENAQLVRAMTEVGYDLLQGYHFSPPVAEDDLVDLLHRQRRQLQVHGPSVGADSLAPPVAPVEPALPGAPVEPALPGAPVDRLAGPVVSAGVGFAPAP